MAFYYVKAGLTGTGDQGRYASQQTGSFPTGNGGYTSISAAFSASTAPTHGDFICISDASTTTSYSSGQTFSGPTSDGTGVSILSVSDTNCDQYSSGAKESATGGTGAMNFQGKLCVAGIEFDVGGGQNGVTGDGCDHTFYECTFTSSDAASEPVRVSGAAAHAFFHSCTFNYSLSTSDSIYVGQSAGCIFRAVGCTFTGPTTDEAFISANGQGAQIILEGCDFSGMTGSSYMFTDTHWSNITTSDIQQYTMRGCELASGMAFYNSAPPARTAHFLLATNTVDSSGTAEYQYFYITGQGQAEEDTSFYRDNSTAFPSGQKISLKIASDSNASAANPLIIDVPARYAQLSNTNTDNINLYVLSATALDGGDIYAEVVYPDGTNAYTPNYLLDRTDALVPDAFRTVGTLTTNSETWTGRTTENRYTLTLDSSSDPGGDCVPTVKFYLTRASTTVYLCPTVELT